MTNPLRNKPLLHAVAIGAVSATLAALADGLHALSSYWLAHPTIKGVVLGALVAGASRAAGVLIGALSDSPTP